MDPGEIAIFNEEVLQLIATTKNIDAKNLSVQLRAKQELSATNKLLAFTYLRSF